MTTWAQLLANIRLDLKDTGTTPRYSSELILLYAKDAIRDYSTYLPLRKDEVTMTLSGGAYSVPTDLVNIVDVQCPKGKFLERRQERPGSRYYPAALPLLYYVAGGKIYLDHTPLSGDGVYLTYDALHPIPSSTNDTTWNSTYPDADEELIRLYVKAKANEHIRTQQAALDRFKLGSGDRDDNPLSPEVLDLMTEYHRKLAERMPGGAIRLWRPGRIR